MFKQEQKLNKYQASENLDSCPYTMTEIMKYEAIAPELNDWKKRVWVSGLLKNYWELQQMRAWILQAVEDDLDEMIAAHYKGSKALK